jgi:uncharacterized membrane protein
MSLVGWVHTILAVVALVAGAFNLLRPKGTPSHRWGGRVFAVSMVGLCGTALAIYRFTGRFNTFHALAFASLLTLAVGLFPVIFKRPRRYWLDMHYFAIGAAYAGLLAAFANELLARVPGLQSIVGHGPLIPALIAHIFQAGAVLGQFITLLAFALLLWRHDAVMAKLGRRQVMPATSHGYAGLSDILLLFGAISLIGGVVAQFAPVASVGVWQFLATILAAYQFAGDWFALALAASGGGALLFAGWRLRPPPETPLLAREATS